MRKKLFIFFPKTYCNLKEYPYNYKCKEEQENMNKLLLCVAIILTADFILNFINRYIEREKEFQRILDDVNERLKQQGLPPIK